MKAARVFCFPTFSRDNKEAGMARTACLRLCGSPDGSLNFASDSPPRLRRVRGNGAAWHEWLEPERASLVRG